MKNASVYKECSNAFLLFPFSLLPRSMLLSVLTQKKKTPIEKFVENERTTKIREK
jgi:hypothetical protein